MLSPWGILPSGLPGSTGISNKIDHGPVNAITIIISQAALLPLSYEGKGIAKLTKPYCLRLNLFRNKSYGSSMPSFPSTHGAILISRVNRSNSQGVKEKIRNAAGTGPQEQLDHPGQVTNMSASLVMLLPYSSMPSFPNTHGAILVS